MNIGTPKRNKRRRETYFDIFAKQPGHEDLTNGEYFFCPLCRRGFDRDALHQEPPQLTLAHIVPKALGGKWQTLACFACNSTNGTDLERDLVRSQEILDWHAGVGPIEVRLGEEGKISATLTRKPDENRFVFEIRTPMESPSVKEHYERMKNIDPVKGHEIKFRFDVNRDSRTRAAIYQSALLLLFRQFGYDFIRRDTYRSLIDQVAHPDEEIAKYNIVVLSDKMKPAFENDEAAVMFVQKPFPSILSMLRFRSPGKRDQCLGVMLPGPGETLPETELPLHFSGGLVKYNPQMLKEKGYFVGLWNYCRNMPVPPSAG
jgi:hypothetical protein